MATVEHGGDEETIADRATARQMVDFTQEEALNISTRDQPGKARA
jgi:hypothetical protein